ncbi:MAG: helix-turn-helix domain-containing protein [Alphaproteobacteria bacterium]
MSTFSITNELLADSACPTPSSGIFSFCVGQTLRKARENRDLTLDQISEQLRLTRHVIEAIEEGRHLDVAQNHAYLRGFVRSYAKILELDPETISQKFKEELPPSDEEQELIFPIKVSNKTFPRKWIFFFSLTATAIVSLVSFYLVQDMHQTAVQDEPEISSFLDRSRLFFDEPIQVESKISGALLKSFLKTGKIIFSQTSGFLISSSTRFALQRGTSK